MSIKNVCKMEPLNTKYGMFIVKKMDGNIKEIYDKEGGLLLKVNEKQYIEFLIYTKLGESVYTIDDEKIPAMINIFEYGKDTMLFDLSNRRKVAKSFYEDASFSYFNSLILEKRDNVIKAIYDLDGNIILAGKQKDPRFEIDTENNCVKEIFPNGLCHCIYIEEKDELTQKPKFKQLYYSGLYDLSLIKDPSIDGVGKIFGTSILMGHFKGINKIFKIL